MLSTWKDVYFWLFGVSFLIFGQVVVSDIAIKLKYKIDCKSAQREYKRDQEVYAAQLREYERSYEQKMKPRIEALAYNTKVRAEMQEQYSIACSNYEMAEKYVADMEAARDATSSLLEDHYSQGVVFGKYRNLAAMCTMYEYFVTGRVSELSGANGAYNLYESELRQNIIIAKLDIVIAKLDQIRENQYVLFSEIVKAADTLNNLEGSISAICSNTTALTEYAQLDTYLDAITAYHFQYM